MNRKLERVFNSERELVKKYGRRMATKIMMRLAVLKNARTLDDVPVTPPERRHRLRGEREGQYAIDLVQPHRLVFEPRREPSGTHVSDEPDPGGVTAITIIEVVDYH